ncbi:MAG TPA: hypothetical protein VFW23_14960 [Tepidisphaeraceae bacterium]|nr:hypothetical protein [Tepidisphaeraceae bacterium]
MADRLHHRVFSRDAGNPGYRLVHGQRLHYLDSDAACFLGNIAGPETELARPSERFSMGWSSCLSCYRAEMMTSSNDEKEMNSDRSPQQKLDPSADDIKRPWRLRWLTAASIVFFFGAPPGLVLFLALSPDFDPSLSRILIVGAIGWLWLLSAFLIYDALFAAAEARWPAAKTVREILGPILKSLFYHHHG